MIVVDSGSQDNTIEVAKACGATVHSHPWQGFGKQRNLGASLAKNNWILFLDADEEMSPSLASEICAFFESDLHKSHDVAILPRSACYMGKAMQHYRPMCGEKLARLYDRTKTQWTEALVHERVKTEGLRLRRFQHSFLHHHSPTLVHKHFKFLKYSELHCLDNLDNKIKLSILILPLTYMAVFLKELIVRRALGDGMRGFIVSHVSAVYACYKKIRRYEMQFNPSSIPVGKKVLIEKNNWDDDSEV